jgi:hypothetical protein
MIDNEIVLYKITNKDPDLNNMILMTA